jgi:hypothetical protein
MESSPLDHLFSNYLPDEVLGIGAHGIVVKFVSNPDQEREPIAVKISETLNECELNLKFKHIFEKSELFGKIYSCFTSNELSSFDKQVIIDAIDIPEIADLILNKEIHGKKVIQIEQKPLVFILSEFISGSSFYYIDDEVTEDDIYSILFEIKYAIDWAFKSYNFTHNDLHVNNVMITKNKNHRSYEIDGKFYTITSIYQPKIIDYDKASTEFKENIDYDYLVGSLLYYQKVMFKKRFKIKRENASNEEFILKKFESLKRAKFVNFKCHICPERAHVCFDTNQAYKFCGRKCANKMPPLLFI